MFITLEGIEGSGKSTLLKNIELALNALSRKTFITREPGGSSLGKQLRPLLLNSHADPLTQEAELLLFLADRAEHVQKVVKPALTSGYIVLCDRYTDSTLAYQGYGRGIDKDFITSMNSFACKNCLPDMTFILDLDVTLGLSRANKRNADEHSQEGRFEAENIDFHKRIRKGFLEIAQANPERIIILDATQEPSTLCKQAMTYITGEKENTGKNFSPHN